MLSSHPELTDAIAFFEAHNQKHLANSTTPLRHIALILQNLHWHRLIKQIQFNVLLLICKAIHHHPKLLTCSTITLPLKASAPLTLTSQGHAALAPGPHSLLLSGPLLSPHTRRDYTELSTLKTQTKTPLFKIALNM